jgi:hypothetical protein
MGTRGIIGFAIDGEPKVTYNHFDSYPEGLGVEFLAACRTLVQEPKAVLVQRIADLQVVKDFDADGERVKPPAEAVEALAPWTNLTVDETHPDGTPTWYQLTRELQGDVVATLKSGYVIDASDFPLNGLFCEWGYVLNLTSDGGSLEVYEGFKTEVPSAGLWAGRPTLQECEANYKAHVARAEAQGRKPWEEQIPQYKAIEKVAEFSLDNLPDDETFVKTIHAASRYAEED